MTLVFIVMEEWKDVPGFNGKYQISIDTPEGKCRSLNLYSHKTPKVLSNTPGKRDGRIKWVLRSNGKSVCYQAAKWIAMTYPELVQNEYFEGAEIDHIDTNRLNNHPSNLRWVTRKENANNPLTKKHKSVSFKGRTVSTETREKMSALFKNNSYNSKPVKQYTKTGIFVTDYPSINEAHRNIPKASTIAISKCCRKCPKYITAGGFKWEYA